MYYQYDGIRNVVGLTNRHGDEIEEYRYDAFGNIYTGITAPYNSVGYTGHEYDEKSGLINMSARWYNSNNGRFITQDTYQGDIYTPQSLNRYAYVMNNPVNMWDPTGHVPSWVGDSSYSEWINYKNCGYVINDYSLISSSSSSTGWELIDKITRTTEIIYKYKDVVYRSWTHEREHYNWDIIEDPETGNVVDLNLLGTTTSTVHYSDTDYYYRDVVKKASEIAQENEQYIRNLAGDPPGDNDPPMFTVSTMQVDNGRIELLNPDEIILRNTGKKPTASERLIAGAVQSELNSIFNTQLDVDGWYGGQSAGTVADLQKELSLPATGVLDVQTFYQLQLAVESGAWYERSAEQVPAGAVIQQPTGNTGSNYSPPSSVWGDYNGNGIPDQYEGYAQGTSYKAYGSVGSNYAPSSIQGDYNGNGIPDQYDGYAQGTGNKGSSNFFEALIDNSKLRYTPTKIDIPIPIKKVIVKVGGQESNDVLFNTGDNTVKVESKVILKAGVSDSKESIEVGLRANATQFSVDFSKVVVDISKTNIVFDPFVRIDISQAVDFTNAVDLKVGGNISLAADIRLSSSIKFNIRKPIYNISTKEWTNFEDDFNVGFTIKTSKGDISTRTNVSGMIKQLSR